MFSTILLKNPVDMDLDTTKACLQTSDRTATNHQGNADMEACKARPVEKPTTIVTMNLHITWMWIQEESGIVWENWEYVMP